MVCAMDKGCDSKKVRELARAMEHTPDTGPLGKVA